MKRLGGPVIVRMFLAHLLGATASACPECRARVESGIYGRDFAANLLFLLLPILIIVVIGGGLYYADGLRNRVDGGGQANGE